MKDDDFIDITDIHILRANLKKDQLVRIIFKNKPVAWFKAELDEMRATEVLTLKYLEFGLGVHNG